MGVAMDLITKKTQLSDINKIVNYFLGLFKLQLGASVEDQANFFLLGYADDLEAEKIYELRVKQGEKQTVRRMTVGPLGESSGSKSRCYKVIYDENLVIKIPPHPITDFDQYIQNIDMERQIAENLSSSIECIVPSVSTVLKKLPFFANKIAPNPSAYEIMCIHWLKKKVKLQDFLRIGESFVFFMNLSTYSFLGQVIEKLHNIRNHMLNEIGKQSDILWNLMVFEEKYGSANASVFFKINEVYSVYEEKVNRLLQQYGLASSVPLYKKKEWFLIHLSGKSVVKTEFKSPDAFADDLNITFRAVYKKEKKDIDTFRNMIKGYIQKKTFLQNRFQLEGIITNILDLLARLRAHNVAMRDLKPDNVFVVGDLSKSRQLLAEVDKYAIGLIDFETAVVFETSKNEKLSQPMLAGTPSYATPSHLFRNEVLKAVYPEFPAILHFQDWQAVIGIIYNVLTGERLAGNTSKFLPEIGKAIRKSSRKITSLTDIYKKASRTYWCNAVEEFKEKIKNNEKILKVIVPGLSPNACEMLRSEARKIIDRTQKQIWALIKSQKMFTSEKSRNELISASSEVVCRCRNGWKNGKHSADVQPETRQIVVDLLDELEKLKLQYETLSESFFILNQNNPKMSSYQLLELMFLVVFKTMYQEQWDKTHPMDDILADADSCANKDVTATYFQEVPQEETMVIEKTIVID